MSPPRRVISRNFGVRRPDGVVVQADDEAEATALWETTRADGRNWELVSQEVITYYHPWEAW